MKLLKYIFIFIFLGVSAQTPHLDLTTKRAFPGAFGAGANLTGGRGGTIYVVDNLNDSGSGSFRAALTATGTRTIIIKVEGLVNLSSWLLANSAGNGNVTVWGQFAPGRGMTFTGDMIRMDNCTNIIMRHITGQNKTRSGYGTIRIEDLPAGGGVYYDHLSVRYGLDQTLDIISRNSDNRSTAAYCLLAEADPGHNTAGIFGDSGSGAVDTGESTFARNMTYNISHRFPNVSGSYHDHENYNNFINNWSARIIQSQGANLKIDFFKNYYKLGNRSQSSGTPVNKMGANGVPNAKFYVGWNYMGGVDTTPNDNQTNMWVNYKSNSEGADNAPVNSGHYVSARQNSFLDPSDGIWDAVDVPAKTMASVGHNRGINADGTPGFFRDDKDANYVTRVTNGTTESAWRSIGSWDNSTFTGTSLCADTDGDHMPDWFENQHAHLDPNDAGDRDTTHVSWDFDLYTVDNDCGYTNLEMCAAFYAGDFETMIDGTNDLSLVADGGVGVTGVSITGGGDTVEVGETGTLTAVIAPVDADDQTFSWSSSNTGLATIDSSGEYTGVAVGPEELSNTGLASDTVWEKQTGWTISDNGAHCDGTQTSGSSLFQDVDLDHGTFTMSVEIYNYGGTGTIKMFPGGFNGGTTISGNGIYTQTIRNIHPSQDGKIYFQADANFVGSIRFPSCKEIPDFTVTTTDGGHTASKYVTVVDSGEEPTEGATEPNGVIIDGTTINSYYLNGVKYKMKD